MTTNMNTKTPRELLEAARIKYFVEAVAENHEDLFHEYATTALSLLPSLFEAHDAEIAALKAAQPAAPDYLLAACRRAVCTLAFMAERDELFRADYEALDSAITKASITQPAPAAPYQVPNGWLLVPVEPNHQMLEYFDRVRFRPLGVSSESAAKSMYAAMLAAAPKAAA